MVRVYIFARPDLSRMPAACNISACCVHASAVRTHWTSCVMKEACPTGTCVRGGSTPPGLVKNGVLRCTPSSRIYHTSCSRLQENGPPSNIFGSNKIHKCLQYPNNRGITQIANSLPKARLAHTAQPSTTKRPALVQGPPPSRLRVL